VIAGSNGATIPEHTKVNGIPKRGDDLARRPETADPRAFASSAIASGSIPSAAAPKIHLTAGASRAFTTNCLVLRSAS